MNSVDEAIESYARVLDFREMMGYEELDFIRDMELVLDPVSLTFFLSRTTAYQQHEHYPTYTGRFLDKLIQNCYNTGLNYFSFDFHTPPQHFGSLKGTPENPLRIAVMGIDTAFHEAAHCDIAVHTHREFNALLAVVPKGNTVKLKKGTETLKRVQL